MMNRESVVTYDDAHDIHLVITGNEGDWIGGVREVAAMANK
jgi:hypothetical protein